MDNRVVYSTVNGFTVRTYSPFEYTPELTYERRMMQRVRLRQGETSRCARCEKRFTPRYVGQQWCGCRS